MSVRVCVVREATGRKERLACVRARALAATREATVVHVYNTAMKSIASAVIERNRVLSTVQRAEFPEGRGRRSRV
jgi:hypothetical protein